MSWYPPNVDLDVVSTLEDVVEVSDDLGGEVFCCWLGVVHFRIAAWLSTKIQMVFVLLLFGFRVHFLA